MKAYKLVLLPLILAIVAGFNADVRSATPVLTETLSFTNVHTLETPSRSGLM